jgi:hypothetical protein
MTTILWTDVSGRSSVADSALKVAVRAWFLVAVAGQWIFLGHLVAFYAGSAVRGDTIGNGAIAVHLLLAVIIMVGGPLQLISQIRRHAASFHHWNGRLYILAVFLTSVAGLYMLWSRERAGIVYLGASLHAVSIMSFAVFAVRSAIGRDLRNHRRWALRLFMVVNAGWFFRIGVMQWMFLGPRAPGVGSFVNAASVADYVLPLVLLELYLRMEDSAGKFTMAAGILVLSLVLAVRIVAM